MERERCRSTMSAETGPRGKPASDVALAAIEVYSRLGPGLELEVYLNALYLELEKQEIRYRRHVVQTVRYDGLPVGSHTLELVVEDCLVVSVLIVPRLRPIHEARLAASLRLAGLRDGLLISFDALPLDLRYITR